MLGSASDTLAASENVFAALKTAFLLQEPATSEVPPWQQG
jgi:hypothetical protein